MSIPVSIRATVMQAGDDDDGGIVVVLSCGQEAARALAAYLYQEVALTIHPDPGACDHGVIDGEWCALCRTDVETARRENGP